MLIFPYKGKAYKIKFLLGVYAITDLHSTVMLQHDTVSTSMLTN
jgi:hypothetical protein